LVEATEAATWRTGTGELRGKHRSVSRRKKKIQKDGVRKDGQVLPKPLRYWQKMQSHAWATNRAEGEGEEGGTKLLEEDKKRWPEKEVSAKNREKAAVSCSDK